MVKIKRVRSLDAVVVAFRFGKEEGTVGSLILGLYDDDGELRVVGHTSGFTRQAEARAARRCSSPTAPASAGTASRAAGSPSEELVWEGLRPELVCEIQFDHITGERIRHGAKFVRWREDKSPRECLLDQLRG